MSLSKKFESKSTEKISNKNLVLIKRLIIEAQKRRGKEILSVSKEKLFSFLD